MAGIYGVKLFLACIQWKERAVHFSEEEEEEVQVTDDGEEEEVEVEASEEEEVEVEASDDEENKTNNPTTTLCIEIRDKIDMFEIYGPYYLWKLYTNEIIESILQIYNLFQIYLCSIQSGFRQFYAYVLLLIASTALSL